MTAAHSPTSVGLDQVVSLGAADQVQPAVWDRLARRGFHLHAWFRAAENSGCKPRHLGIANGEGLKAIIPAFLAGGETPHDLHHRWFGPVRELVPRAGFSLRPVLSVQSPFAQGSEPLGDFESLASRTLHQVFAALEDAAAHDGAKAVVWPFVDAWQYRLIGVARERGYGVYHAGVTAVLRVRWPSFADYLESRSKSVRRTIRSEMANLAASGIRTTVTTDFSGETSAMDALYRESFRRRNQRETPLAPQFLQELARGGTGGIRAFLTWYGDRLIGSSVNLITPQLMDGTLAAFARAHLSGPVFYNDLFYEPIRLAIAEGIEAIDLGGSALYAKVLRGGILQRRVVLIRGTSAARHRALTVLGRVIGHRTEQKERASLGKLWGPRCFEDELEP